MMKPEKMALWPINGLRLYVTATMTEAQARAAAELLVGCDLGKCLWIGLLAGDWSDADLVDLDA